MPTDPPRHSLLTPIRYCHHPFVFERYLTQNGRGTLDFAVIRFLVSLVPSWLFWGKGRAWLVTQELDAFSSSSQMGLSLASSLLLLLAF